MVIISLLVFFKHGRQVILFHLYFWPTFGMLSLTELTVSPEIFRQRWPFYPLFVCMGLIGYMFRDQIKTGLKKIVIYGWWTGAVLANIIYLRVVF